MHINGAFVRVLIPGAPQRVQQLITADRAGGVFHQVRQKLKFFKSEHKRLTIQEHLTSRQINQHAIGMRGLRLGLNMGVCIRLIVDSRGVPQRVPHYLKVASLRAGGGQRYRGIRLRFRS